MNELYHYVVFKVDLNRKLWYSFVHNCDV